MMTVLCVIVCLLFLLLIGSYIAYRRVFFSPKAGRDKLPDFASSRYDETREEILSCCRDLVDRPCEFVTIRSVDGLELSGRYYHICDGAPLDIGFHGYRSSCLTDFSGGSILSRQMGHNLLLVDQRAHGRSEGSTIAFGIEERWDVLSWVDYAIARFGPEVKIILYGISMGGTSVLMASGLNLPANVRAILADCPYNAPKDIIRHVMESMNMPVWLIWPFIRLGARIFGGFSLCQTDAAQAVRSAKVPVLILHGEADSFVPFQMSQKIQRANPALVRYVSFPGADHGLSFLIDSAGYRSHVQQLIADTCA